MTTTTLSPATTGAVDWEPLRRAVAGRLVLPTDRDWEESRVPWAVNIDQQPAAILHVLDADDVVAAVRFARDHGVAVTAQPGGHGARTTLDGTLLLRTRALQGIEVDLDRETATVGAGVKWGELCQQLDGTGLMGLCGSNPDPTVVGLMLGGGVSWFTRKHGFTANSVLAVDIVTPEGELVRVDHENDPELFWAVRGGGGDFGIVVRVTIRLYPAPELYGGQLMWEVEHAATVMRAFRDLALVAPRELTMWFHIIHFPDMEDIPEPLRDKTVVNVASTYLGSKKMAEILLWSLREAAPVWMDTMAEIQPSQLGDVAMEPTEPMPVVEHSSLIGSLDDATIDLLVDAVADRGRTTLDMLQIRSLGGGFAEAPEGRGAVEPVTAPFLLFVLGVPATPELAAGLPASIAAVDAAAGHLATGRRLPNFVGHAQDTTSGYAPTTLARLRDIKRRRDPQGVIRSNKPVLAGS
ncbi:FAD-binding oxidoreductase [Nocardioides sp. GCM10027113]|uniref:FAD-binding oxidoreductase n=1 Tax=unclassified Nocardioides TaxID=2615069 RepID=UPI003620A706